MGWPSEHLATFIGSLIVASLCDLEARRVPNAVSVGLLVSGLGARLVNGGPSSFAQGLLGALLVLAVAYLPWRRGWIGGGDVKVAVSAASWVGLHEAPWFLLAAALLGGPLALWAWWLAPKHDRAIVGRGLWLWLVARLPVASTGEGTRSNIPVPYAVAICAGAILTVLVPG